MERTNRLSMMPILIWTICVWIFSPPGAEAQFDYRVKFYREECPQARELVKDVVLKATAADMGLSAALLRLNFHDCFIRGCDGSVLLDSNFTNIAEKDGFGNMFSLRGYRVIDDAKAAVEAVCPNIVSCADILTLAARDAIASIGGPAWRVTSGRRDGVVSYASETIDNLPAHYSDFADLTRLFAKKNFTAKEMVVLAGAHTIGRTKCGMIHGRLYNNSGPDGVDPTLNATYAVELKKQCPFRTNFFKHVPMDPTNHNNTFDTNYFKNLQHHKGLFKSDAALVSNVKGRALVALQTSTRRFFLDFGAAMEKMINTEILISPQGEIRTNCRHTN